MLHCIATDNTVCMHKPLRMLYNGKNELTLADFYFVANDDLKSVFAAAKEGNIRVIKVDIQDGMFL